MTNYLAISVRKLENWCSIQLQLLGTFRCPWSHFDPGNSTRSYKNSGGKSWFGNGRKYKNLWVCMLWNIQFANIWGFNWNNHGWLWFINLIFVIDKNQDQLATIIHRGRDHGLPTYTQVRESCGLLPVTTFSELNNTVDDQTIAALQKTYQVQ